MSGRSSFGSSGSPAVVAAKASRVGDVVELDAPARHRRTCLRWAAATFLAAPAAAAHALRGGDDEAPAGAHDRLRQGGVVVLLRHALTTPGTGDPPGFQLGDCGTQRNLSEAGRVQARQIGRWFREQGLQPRAVRSSAWCRCIDTAQAAFGAHILWPPLNSFFQDAPQQAERQRLAMLRALAALPADGFEVWVTHQVNITALTGAWVEMGEAFVVGRDAGILARLPLPR